MATRSRFLREFPFPFPCTPRRGGNGNAVATTALAVPVPDGRCWTRSSTPANERSTPAWQNHSHHSERPVVFALSAIAAGVGDQHLAKVVADRRRATVRLDADLQSAPSSWWPRPRAGPAAASSRQHRADPPGA